MQDRIRVKKIMKAVAEKATQVKDALNVDVLIKQAIAQVKRGYEEEKKRRKNRDREQIKKERG